MFIFKLRLKFYKQELWSCQLLVFFRWSRGTGNSFSNPVITSDYLDRVEFFLGWAPGPRGKKKAVFKKLAKEQTTFIGLMSTDFQLHRARKAWEVFSLFSEGCADCTTALIAFGKCWMNLFLEIVYSIKNVIVTLSMKLCENLCIPFMFF